VRLLGPNRQDIVDELPGQSPPGQEENLPPTRATNVNLRCAAPLILLCTRSHPAVLPRRQPPVIKRSGVRPPQAIKFIAMTAKALLKRSKVK